MNEQRKNHCYVITGGPGVGKTTLLNELVKSGYSVVPENAREIIKQEIAVNGDGLPWKNKTRYTQLMLEAAAKSFDLVPLNGTGIIFFDRGILDALCYADMVGIEISEEMDRMGKELRYNKTVFILPPWEEIYHTDSERKQSWEEAVWTFEKMKETYLKYGYQPLEVPKDTPENREDFIRSCINGTYGHTQ